MVGTLACRPSAVGAIWRCTTGGALVDAATPPFLTWNKQPVNTGTPSPDRCQPAPSGSTAKTRVSPGTTSTSTTTATRSPAPRARSAWAGRNTRYAVRSGVEGTVNEFAHGHGTRRCRYRGQGKAHIQHDLTAVAVYTEGLSGLPPTEESPTPRRPTAFQNHLFQREMPRPKSWRTLSA
ncbi:transposase [Streptomyces vinaceus]|uniref:transposase n=1 Tax=Streptomyces vinaceus TaxID=1960 RepID=UPI0035DF8D1E